MAGILSDEELRKFAIDLLSIPSDRTRQTRIGASNLSNQCDRDLAYDLLGIKRSNPQAERIWMNAEIGTAIHSLQEDRLEYAIRRSIEAVVDVAPDAQAERHVWFGHIEGYGDIGGTIDLDLAGQIADWKGSTRQKSCILQDFIAIQRGEEPPFGRKHKNVAGPGRGMMPQSEYDKEMTKVEYKMTGYYGQQSLYMLGREKEGRPVDRGSIIWINRDGNGYFDVPSLARYDDPKAVHDVWPLTFAYNRQYALDLIARGQRIWDALQAGATPQDFDAHDMCWWCSMQAEAEEKKAQPIGNLDAPIHFEQVAA